VRGWLNVYKRCAGRLITRQFFGRNEFSCFTPSSPSLWHYRDQPKQITVCFGGSFFSLALLVRWLRQLWFDKNFIDLIGRATSQLAPLEVAKLISTYYELMLRGKSIDKNSLPGSP
jgi:hypothetical protein